MLGYLFTQMLGSACCVILLCYFNAGLFISTEPLGWHCLRWNFSTTHPLRAQAFSRGHMMRFQVFLSLWIITSWLCIDKIPEVANTKVSKPKRYSLSNVRLCHAPLNRLIQTCPTCLRHDVESICIIQPKCSCKAGRHGFSNHGRAEAMVSRRSCVSTPK